MHELSLCEGILQSLKDSAKKHNFRKVKTVILEIGKLSGVEKNALLFSFDIVFKGSLAEAAKLEIIDIPGKAWCMRCSISIKIEQRFDACPNCGSYQLQITGGDELRIKELEVD